MGLYFRYSAQFFFNSSGTKIKPFKKLLCNLGLLSNYSKMERLLTNTLMNHLENIRSWFSFLFFFFFFFRFSDCQEKLLAFFCVSRCVGRDWMQAGCFESSKQPPCRSLWDTRNQIPSPERRWPVSWSHC